MIRALMTDFGGVLVRTTDDAARRELEARLGLPTHTIDDRVFNCDASLRGQVGELSFSQVWEQIGRDLNIDGRISVDELRDQFFSGDSLDEDLMALIRGVRPGIQTALISNAWSNARRLFTRTYRIADAFDTMVISAEEKVAKPDPRIYQIALDRLGVNGAEAIFVDDVLDNVLAAQALGMRGVRFRSTQQAQADIRRQLAE